jgi:hypothetical protein
LATSEVMNTVLPARDSPVTPRRITGSKNVSDRVSPTAFHLPSDPVCDVTEITGPSSFAPR